MNCFLIVIDTLRADHLKCYGYFRNTSPNIDKIAKNGVLFKDAYVTAMATGPAFSSIITGLAPIHHHFYVTPYNIPNLIDFDDSILTLAEMISELPGNFTTAAFDNLIDFSSHMDHMVRGYEYYINTSRFKDPDPRVHASGYLTGDKINKRLFPWLEQHKNENMFVFMHYWEPHTPYNQPKEFRNIFQHKPGNLSDLKVCKAPAGYSYVPGWGKVGEFFESSSSKSDISIDLYDGEIFYVDTLIGEVINKLDELKIKDETMIIITADHGEQLGQHGSYTHDKVIEGVIHIPLIFYYPQKLPTGKVITGYVQQADIVPTILKMLGCKKNYTFDGEDLIPIIFGKKLARNEIIIEDHYYRALIKNKWKYIRDYFSGQEELYNLEIDPIEVIDLATKETKILNMMMDKLNKWIRKNLEGKPDPMWEQVAKWSAMWNVIFGEEFPKTKPKPVLVEGVDFLKQ